MLNKNLISVFDSSDRKNGQLCWNVKWNENVILSGKQEFLIIQKLDKKFSHVKGKEYSLRFHTFHILLSLNLYLLSMFTVCREWQTA